MAKAPWIKAPTPTPAPAPAPTSTTELSAEQKRALFIAWDDACATLSLAQEQAQAAAKAAVKSAQERVVASIRVIIEKLGKGPFNWRGRIVTPIARKVRGGEGKTYIMRAPETRDVAKIE